MSNLIALSDFAKGLGAHAPLKPQPGGYDTLFVCVEETPNNYGEDITTWKHVITIDDNENQFKIGFRGMNNSKLLPINETKLIVKEWVGNPTRDYSKYYENT